MNKKTVLITISAFTVTILFLLGMLMYSFANDGETQMANTRARNSSTVTTPTIVDGEYDPNSYSYKVGIGTFECLTHNSYDIPTYGGYQIYCIEPGGQIRYKYQIRYDEALEMVGEQHSSDCVFLHGHADTPREGDKTPPVFFAKGISKLSPAAAYIVSDTPIGSFSIDKQRGLWNLRDTGNDGGFIMGSGKSEHDGPSSFDVVANDYADFDEKVRDVGMQPEDLTNIDEVTTKVNQSTNEYTVGPFTINYTSGIYGNIAFGGITNIRVSGYNKYGQLVDSDIEIERIILQDSATSSFSTSIVPEYFEPDEVTKVDRTPQLYPAPGQSFQIVFSDPNQGLSSNSDNRIAYISLNIEFQYMLANGEYKTLEGIKFEVAYEHDESVNQHKHSFTEPGPDGVSVTHTAEDHGCITTCYLAEHKQQHIAAADAIRTIYEQEIQMHVKIDTTMDLGGHVWEDSLASKESIADGISNTQGEGLDNPLPNVKVTLYTEDGEIAGLLSDETEAGISDEKLMHRVNPTYTDDEGNYLFEGLDPMEKYYVVFEYNGQKYLPTEYLNTANGQYNSVSQMVNAGLYNSDPWSVTSKGTESNTETFDGVEISRDEYDKRFQEIAQYPNNYKSSNSLGVVGEYNAVYSQLDLMGYTLDGNGKYSQTEVQLIDGFEYNERGLETDTFKEGEITSRIKDYIRTHKEYPSERALKDIYQQIAGNDQELWRKIQFIEDVYIQAYTGSPFTQDIDLYPVYNAFVINHAEGNEEYETAAEAQQGNYSMRSVVIDGVTYRPIYPGQFYVNLGLWRRQEFDSSLRKDVYKAALKINRKTVVYNYDKRAEEEDGANNANGEDNNTYWDINVRMSDYDAYYNTGYNREIYETDYSYDSQALNHPGIDLEMYITYKITIRNQSMSIMGQINEIVDYYDADYTFKPNLSWVMYQTTENRNLVVNDDDYYSMMEQEQEIIDNESTSPSDFIDNARETGANEGSSIYGNEKNLGEQYKNLYITGLDDKKLATGETAYIYLTFEVNKDENGRIILDGDSSPKENLAEINGFETYYRDNTELPNNVTKNSSNIAGLLDRDSNPGNLVASDLTGDRYERNFEDDTDRAPSLRVLIDEEAVRKANGTVWEDQRTETVGNQDASEDAIIGDGIRQEEEIGISGVTVQLVEKCIDGSEYIWQETTTNENGIYNFESYIPGDYVIRFYYGDTELTVLPSEQQSVSYNGHDFKSTTYQDGIEQSGKTDISGRFDPYTNTQTQNESGTYGYDIYKSDSSEVNYSDAKDIWSTTNRENLNIIGPVQSRRLVQGRQEVINYSTNNVTNHIAEVLASPYERPTYNGTEYSDEEMNALYQELMNETYMTAETGVIVVEFEYDRQQSDGLKATQNNAENSSKNYIGDNQYNSNYSLNNVDLGLTERPKAQLEIDKSISNIKVTLANNNILFDINEAANNALWQDHEEYSIDQDKMDAEDDRVGDNEYYQTGDAIGMYEEYYTNENRHRYSYRDEIDDIVNRTDRGLVQLTMDQELMHGATIQVTYRVKVTNVGEVDYVDGDSKNFYYKGDITGAHISTTTTNQVIDYVQNNLQFEANNETNRNDGWQVKPATEILSEGLVNSDLTDNLSQFNTIIQTESFNTALKPGEEITKTLILSQLITPENTEDDLTYNNMVEIVKTSNELGRRMAYSVVGNQDPSLDDASEVDTSSAERIVILPPFGEVRIYYAIGAIVAVVLIGGIILIKKRVLKKRK